jgi:hypothetical protein
MWRLLEIARRNPMYLSHRRIFYSFLAVFSAGVLLALATTYTGRSAHMIGGGVTFIALSCLLIGAAGMITSHIAIKREK